MKGNSPVLSECDVNEKSWQLMRNNVAEVDANRGPPPSPSVSIESHDHTT